MLLLNLIILKKLKLCIIYVRTQQKLKKIVKKFIITGHRIQTQDLEKNKYCY